MAKRQDVPCLSFRFYRLPATQCLKQNALGMSRPLKTSSVESTLGMSRAFSQRVVGKRLNFKEKHGALCRFVMLFFEVLQFTDEALWKRSWCVKIF